MVLVIYDLLWLQVSIELFAALLHLQDDYSLDQFIVTRRSALVALAVACPKQVASVCDASQQHITHTCRELSI